MIGDITTNDLTPERLQRGASTRRWAIVRLVLGQAQMGGAIVSAVLLLSTGVNAVTLFAVVITCVLTGLSVTLFGSRPKK